VRFAELCSLLAEGRDLESAVERTLQLLHQWLVDGLLAAPAAWPERQRPVS
jgi:hypothetical protein